MLNNKLRINKRLFLSCLALLFLIFIVFLITNLELDGLLVELNKRHEWLLKTVDSQYLVALLVYLTIYLILMGFALPFAGFMDLIGGFYLGWAALPIALISVSIGSLPPFFVAKHSLPHQPQNYNGSFFDRVKARFSNNEILLICFLRVIPWAPFSVTTLLAGALKVKTSNYLIGSTVGFLPWGLALNEIGQGLYSILEYQNLSLTGILTSPHFIISAFVIIIIFGLVAFFKS